MDSKEQTTPAAQPKQRVRCAVSPELAALVREEIEAFGATKVAATAVAQAAVDTANATIASAETRRNAALRPILCQLALPTADFMGWEGSGADTVLLLDVPAPTEER